MHTPHPALADVLDMIRLNDANTGKPINYNNLCDNILRSTPNWRHRELV